MRTTVKSATEVMWSIFSFAVLFAFVGQAYARDLSGSYSTTQVITDNSRLTGDVRCERPLLMQPCILFGASHIRLRLNGFTITGPVDPKTDVNECSSPSDATFGVGVQAIDKDDIKIEGPGIIQHFERWGILIRSSTATRYVRHESLTNITGTYNCWSGLQIVFVSDSRFEGNVWANNAIGSNGAACGGLCLVNSNRNTFRSSTYYGNGSVDYPNGNVDFGIGLEGSSEHNIIEESDIGGNTNGILFFDTSSNNVVRRNTIAGNPAAQVVKTFTAPNQQGADISFRPNFAGANNVFRDNYCLTYLQGSGPAEAPCPNIRAHGDEEGTDVDQEGRHREEHSANHLVPPHSNPGRETGILAAALVLLAIAFRRVV